MEIENRVSNLERDHASIRDAISGIERSLEALVRLEERHAETRESLMRAFTLCERLESRMMQVELQMPALNETRAWVVRAILGTVTIVGSALIYLVVAK